MDFYEVDAVNEQLGLMNLSLVCRNFQFSMSVRYQLEQDVPLLHLLEGLSNYFDENDSTVNYSEVAFGMRTSANQFGEQFKLTGGSQSQLGQMIINLS